MFYQCSYQADIRDSAELTVETSVTFRVQQAAGGGAYLVSRSRGSTGTVTIYVYSVMSADLEANAYLIGSMIVGDGIGETAYVQLDDAVGPYLKVTMTPTVDYNGRLAVNYRGVTDAALEIV